jgi:hypothetical protein
VKLLRLWGSWWATAALVAAIVGVYVALAFGGDPYDRWAALMLRTAPGLALYLGLALSMALASVRVVLERLSERGKPATPEAIRAMDEHAFLPGVSLDIAEAFMKEKGFAPVPVVGGLSARKGGLSFVPGTVMRAGTVIFMAALALSAHLRAATSYSTGEGGPVALPSEHARLERIEADMPGEFLQVGEASAFKLGGVRVVVSAAGGRTAEVTPGYPTRLGGDFLRVTHLGYRTDVGVDGKITVLDLDVLPPGKGYKARLSGGREASFVLEPVRTVRKGLLVGKAYDLKAPQFRVSLGDGADRREEVIEPEESASLGGPGLSLGNSSLYVTVEAVRDPALPFLYAGLALALFGSTLMLTRLFWYERRICAALTEGGVLLGYSSEFYRRWGVLRFRRWMDKLP